MIGKLFRTKHSSALSVPEWGGEYRLPITSPLDHFRTMARYEVISTTLKTMSIVFMLIALFASITAVSRMRTINYVSDGSRFGCIVFPVESTLP